MSRQGWVETVSQLVSDGTPVANTTTETAIFPALTVPANFMQDGRTLRMEAFGKLSTTGTPTITFSLRWGGAAGTLLAITEALTNGSGVANVNWSVIVRVQTRTNGSSGSLLAWGEVRLHTAVGTVLVNVFSVSGYDAPAAVTADLSTAKDLCLTATWSAASSSNTLTGMYQTLEALN